MGYRSHGGAWRRCRWPEAVSSSQFTSAAMEIAVCSVWSVTACQPVGGDGVANGLDGLATSGWWTRAAMTTYTSVAPVRASGSGRWAVQARRAEMVMTRVSRMLLWIVNWLRTWA